MTTAPATPDTREHILANGQRIMAGKGFSAVGINEILTAAGVPKGSFYHYFGSKDAFGEALLNSYFDDYLAELDATLQAPGKTMAERLLAYWENWQDTQSFFDCQGKCLAVKLGAEVADLSEAMRHALRRGTSGIVDRLAAAIKAGVADSSLAVDDTPDAAAQSLYQLWLGASVMVKITRSTQPFDNAMAMTRQVLHLPERITTQHTMKILMILTSHDQLGNTGRKTGFWLEELAAPYYAFKDAGADIVLASPKGGQPPLDPKSNEPAFQTEHTHRFEADADATAQLAATVRLASVSQADFDTVFYPGGHGPLWDLAEDAHSIKLIESFLAANKPVALVCHAPGVLRHVKKPDGRPLVEGLKVTGFTNTEEAAVELTDVVPFLVEDELKTKGGLYSKGDDWASYVVSDGLLITGQNPASSEAAAQRLLAALAALPQSLPRPT